MSSLPTSLETVGRDKEKVSRSISRQSSLSFAAAPVFHRENSITRSQNGSFLTGGDGEKTPKKGVFGNRKEKLILLSISLYWFTVNCAYAMIAPFFPGEAKAKGSSTTVTGLIFAVFPLVLFVFSPVIGVVLPIAGSKFTLMAGLFVEGGAQVLFGFLDLMPDGNIFITFCFLVRIVSALGASATSIASLTLLTVNFHENISPAMGVMETFGGFGMMAGPPIGGFLYAAGGFKLPFIVLGAVILVSLIPILFVLPADDKEEDEKEGNRAALWQAIRIPAVAIVAIMTAVGGMALSFMEPTLQGHLQKPFHLNSSQIGLMFLIAPAIYAMTAPFVGYVADKKDTRCIMVIGGFILGISYILLGPAPFLPKSIFPRTLWFNGIALALLGIGVGPNLVPGLSDMNKSVLKYGMANTLATHSALSSIFNAMFNIGAIAGPTLGGILVNYANFAWASAIFGFFLIIWTVILGVFTIFERRKLRSRTGTHDETKPLLT